MHNLFVCSNERVSIQEIIKFNQLIGRPAENDVIYSVTASEFSAVITVISGVRYQMHSSHVVLLTTDKISLINFNPLYPLFQKWKKWSELGWRNLFISFCSTFEKVDD
jgi:hypothetical protein